MVQYIPPPDARTLLSPLLACLPTASVSPRPPPALLPYLSPILRQRVELLSATTPSSSDSWLPQLCWDIELAKKLVDIVSGSDAFEPHPTSGEIELGTIEPIIYRRLDEETLQAKIGTPETSLETIVLWCESDGEEAWRIAEVRPFGDNACLSSNQWYSSVAEAEGKARQKAFDEAIQDGANEASSATATGVATNLMDENYYWAQYDKTPNRTPGGGHSPAPNQTLNRNRHGRTTSEVEYFERYANVQPEMDNEDPSQDTQDVGESTLNGSVLTASQDDSLSHSEPTVGSREHQNWSLIQPNSSSNINSAAISRSEPAADTQPVNATAVRQHVSANMKSLFRLCRGTGMETSEFEGLVRTEMQALSMLEDAE